jgi:predicted ABC-type ATPase
LPATKITKRLRVFAGPNGSGKSTIINAIRKIKVNKNPIDFGIYINADDIAKSLRSHSFSFQHFKLKNISRSLFINSAFQSGLINSNFPESDFRKSFTLNTSSEFRLIDESRDEFLAQLMADFLRKSLLKAGEKISFETVFSHPSKLDLMKAAKADGYKVYLYFVATESPEINVSRIKEVRVKQGGHDVPDEKIRSRYHRTLKLMYDAAELAYQAYFFDNSHIDSGFEPFAHFKLVRGRKKWDKIEADNVPDWFFKHYLSKLT